MSTIVTTDRGSAISCSNCQHWKRAEPYAWGKCEYPTPWWCESRGPIIHPTENNAKDCDCYSPNDAISQPDAKPTNT
jgi:hypothetical protein